MRVLDPVIVQAFLDTVGNTFFSVSFVKKDGTVRHISRARLNVTSRQVGGEAGAAAGARLAANGLIPVVDLDVAEGTGYRSFALDRVVALKGRGEALGAL